MSILKRIVRNYRRRQKRQAKLDKWNKYFKSGGVIK